MCSEFTVTRCSEAHLQSYVCERPLTYVPRYVGALAIVWTCLKISAESQRTRIDQCSLKTVYHMDGSMKIRSCYGRTTACLLRLINEFVGKTILKTVCATTEVITSWQIFGCKSSNLEDSMTFDQSFISFWIVVVICYATSTWYWPTQYWVSKIDIVPYISCPFLATVSIRP